MGAGPTRDLYPLAVSFLGAAGELALMEDDIREMSRSGLRANSATYNAFLCHYAVPGTVLQAEAAAYRLTRSVLLILVNAIHAVALALSATGSTTASASSGTTSVTGAPVTCSTSTSSTFLEMVVVGFRPDLHHCNNFQRACALYCKLGTLIVENFQYYNGSPTS